MRHGTTIYQPDVPRLYVQDGDDEYELFNPRGVEWAALDLVEQRLEEGWYENWEDGNDAHEWEDRAEDIKAREWAIGAMAFLRERKDFEYERIEVRT